jgi:hypothetical protein
MVMYRPYQLSLRRILPLSIFLEPTSERRGVVWRQSLTPFLQRKSDFFFSNGKEIGKLKLKFSKIERSIEIAILLKQT